MRNRILRDGSENQLAFISEIIEFAADNLVKPSIAREVRGETKRRADMESIRVFIDNLRDMDGAPPEFLLRYLQESRLLAEVIGDADKELMAELLGMIESLKSENTG